MKKATGEKDREKERETDREGREKSRARDYFFFALQRCDVTAKQP